MYKYVCNLAKLLIISPGFCTEVMKVYTILLQHVFYNTYLTPVSNAHRK
jgi:hypothetical protein